MRKNICTAAVCLILAFIMALFSASCGLDEFDNNVTLAKLPSTTLPSTAETERSKTQTQNSEPLIGQNKTEKVSFTYTGKIVQRQTIPRDTGYIDGYSGMRDVTSAQIVKDMKLGISVGEYLNGTEANIGALISLLKKMKSDGFNAVRLPLAVGSHLSENKILPSYLKKASAAVKAVLKCNMYCIISLEGTGWLSTSKGDLASSLAALTSVWTQLALEFRSYDDYLLFEGISELGIKNNNITEDDYSALNVLNGAFVSAVRSTGSNNEVRHLIVSTYGSMFDSDTLDAFKIPTDTVKNKLTVDIHLRMPSEFVGVAYIDETRWGSKSDTNTLDLQMYLIYYKITAVGGCPVIFGNFGAADKDNINARMTYASFYVSTAYSYGMTCFWYDDNNDFALYNRLTCEQKFPEIIMSMNYSIR